MRIAVVSDIHGNRTAFEAVLADLKHTSPDLILHGGDLADGGSAPADIVDHIRDLGWQGVAGNGDEMLYRPESLREFAGQSPVAAPLLGVVAEMATATREALGEERLAWLRALPHVQVHGVMSLVHASPTSLWHAPGLAANDAELDATYAPLAKPVVIYAHTHRAHVRRLPRMCVANSGSVSLSYDGDPRAAYLLLNESEPEIRRVAYDVETEIAALRRGGIPHAEWVAKTLHSARPQAF